jgi:TolA-binding protein
MILFNFLAMQEEIVMSRRILQTSASVICLAAAFLFGIANAEATDSTSISQRKVDITSLIAAGKLVEADAAVDKLIADIPVSQGKGKTLQEIAAAFQNAGQADRAIKLCDYVLKNWPNEDFSVWAGMSLAISQIDKQDFMAAEGATERIIADYAGNEDLPTALCVIADTYSWRKMFDRARGLYGIIIEKFPDSPEAGHARLGVAGVEVLSLIEEKNFAPAQQKVDSMDADFKDNENLAQILFRVGQSFCWQRRYDESQNAFGRIIKDFPTSSLVPQARLWRARADVCAIIRRTLPAIDSNAIQATDEEVLEAVDAFLKDFETDAGLPEAMHWISQEYEWTKWAPGGGTSEDAKRYDTPNSVYQKLSQRFSQTDYGRRADWDSKRMAHRTKILTQMDKGDQKETDSAIEQMVAEFSGRPEVPGELCRIAIWYEQHNKFDKAGEIYERIVAQFPDTNFAEESVQDVVRLTTDVKKSINNDEAIGQLAARLRTRLGQTPQLASALCSVGGEYQRQAQISEQVKGDPARAKAFLEEAVQTYNEVIKLAGDSEPAARAYLQSGNCFCKLQKFSDALNCYKEIKGRWPGSRFEPDCLEGIGKCYEGLFKQGQISQPQADAEIEQAYKELLQKYPDHRSNTELLLKLGWLNFRQGQLQEAISYFEKGLTKFPQNGKPADVLYALGRMYEKTGQSDKAIETYEQLQKALPAGPQLDEVNKSIDRLKRQQ